MIVVVAERSAESTDMNLTTVDTELLTKIAQDKSHEDSELAFEWLEAINVMAKEVKKRGHYFEADYDNPSDYIPDDAEVSRKDFPVQVDLACEIFCG